MKKMILVSMLLNAAATASYMSKLCDFSKVRLLPVSQNISISKASVLTSIGCAAWGCYAYRNSKLNDETLLQKIKVYDQEQRQYVALKDFKKISDASKQHHFKNYREHNIRVSQFTAFLCGCAGLITLLTRSCY